MTCSGVESNVSAVKYPAARYGIDTSYSSFMSRRYVHVGGTVASSL